MTRVIARGLSGFTLIELLVVITIFVVLLALLTPGLDRAIYQAELAVCGGQLRVVAAALHDYAMDHRRQFPYRPRARNGSSGAVAYEIRIAPYNVKAQDDRPLYRPYLKSLDLLLDPMVARVDLDTPSDVSHVAASYQIWAGWQYKLGGVLHKGMFKVGDLLAADEMNFDVLVGDTDFNGVQSSHPDYEGRAFNWVAREELVGTAYWTLSLWANAAEGIGTVDRNFALADSSVQRYTNLQHEDGGPLVAIPARANGDQPQQRTYLPRR